MLICHIPGIIDNPNDSKHHEHQPTGRHEMDEHRQHRPLRAPLQAEDIKRQKHQSPCTSPEAQGSRASCASAATRSTVSHKAGQHQQHHEHPPRSRYGREAYKEPQGSVITSHHHGHQPTCILTRSGISTRPSSRASCASGASRSTRSAKADKHHEHQLPDVPAEASRLTSIKSPLLRVRRKKFRCHTFKRLGQPAS